MNEEEKKMVETASYFVSICYAPWFLKFYLSQANDFEAIKTSLTISESWTVFYPGHATIADDEIED
jgi:hypothetical protein